MSKYYTPKIEDLHVGFEFELKSTFMIGGEWKASTIRNPEDIVGLRLNDIARNGEVRVKHLDAEDIKSLDWIHVTSSMMGTTYCIRRERETCVKEIDYVLDVNHDDSITISRILFDGKNTRAIIFDGVIKNKSELKKVLKMLGI